MEMIGNIKNDDYKEFEYKTKKTKYKCENCAKEKTQEYEGDAMICCGRRMLDVGSACTIDDVYYVPEKRKCVYKKKMKILKYPQSELHSLTDFYSKKNTPEISVFV